MLVAMPEPVAAWTRGAVVVALLTAGPAAAQAPEEVSGPADGGSCVLLAIELGEEGRDATLELSIAGDPTSVGARVERSGRMVVDLAGCVPDPRVAGRSFDEGMVSSLQLLQRSGSDGPVTAVAVETRQPFEYTVRTETDRVLLKLRSGNLPEAASPLVAASDERASTDGPPRTMRPLVQVLEPVVTAAPAVPPAAAFSEESARREERDASKIEALVESWARAWSDQRIKDYLSLYASAFQPLEGSRGDWQARRRERLTAPRFIEVELDGLQVQFDEAGRVLASFWQTYRSDRFTDRVYKALTWTTEDGTWKILAESTAELPAPRPAAAGLLEGARLSIARAPSYDPTYRTLAYPGGDPGRQRGSGVDLVVRAYRHLGTDLQQQIHEDILAAMPAYGIAEPDPNIDHRRIRNLLVFLGRRGQGLPADRSAAWQAGDLVFWAVSASGQSGRRPNHVGIVSDRLGAAGNPLVIHHGEGRLPVEEDALFEWPVRARYRWLPPVDATEPADPRPGNSGQR